MGWRGCLICREQRLEAQVRSGGRSEASTWNQHVDSGAKVLERLEGRPKGEETNGRRPGEVLGRGSVWVSSRTPALPAVGERMAGTGPGGTSAWVLASPNSLSRSQFRVQPFLLSGLIHY